MSDIPYARLKIPPPIQERLEAGMKKRERFAFARGAMPMTDDAKLGICYLLSGDEEKRIADAARKTLVDMPTAHVVRALNRDTHPKVLEFLIEFRQQDDELDEFIYRLPDMNDRTARLIVQRADSRMCEMIALNQTRLLLTPKVIIDLKANSSCPPASYSRAESFLRMQREMPEMPDESADDLLSGLDDLDMSPSMGLDDLDLPSGDGLGGLDDLDGLGDDLELPSVSSPAAPVSGLMDLEAEIEAAMAGQQSPALQQKANLDMFDLDQFEAPKKIGESSRGGLGSFSFNFQDTSADFSWNLTAERGERAGEDEGPRSLEMELKEMAVGHKIKLAYKGNKEVRNILIRDRNKTVAVAVIRSGRMSDGEIVSAASNRNLSDDVIREIATNKEFTRKYPVKVALVTNSKTPVPVALSILKSLHKKDLKSLTRSRNVSNVVSMAAVKLFKQKYQRS